MRNFLESITIPDGQRPPDTDTSHDDPGSTMTRKKLDLFDGSAFDMGAYDPMKFSRRGPPVETESVGSEHLSFKILGGERCQGALWEWNAF